MKLARSCSIPEECALARKIWGSRDWSFAIVRPQNLVSFYPFKTIFPRADKSSSLKLSKAEIFSNYVSWMFSSDLGLPPNFALIHFRRTLPAEGSQSVNQGLMAGLVVSQEVLRSKLAGGLQAAHSQQSRASFIPSPENNVRRPFPVLKAASTIKSRWIVTIFSMKSRFVR